ncbi:hypothetical protein Asi02nite_59740 [Asanoa siamensis]|uniref:Uncharacterized protein n=1 Tax=Asanoa siamensis TaxID=926357 RepID=A0ABQ4CYT7_9ACTN|nr:hypothetical protein Asi02nite_59740 [Asanoa siamensis]
MSAGVSGIETPRDGTNCSIMDTHRDRKMSRAVAIVSDAARALPAAAGAVRAGRLTGTGTAAAVVAYRVAALTRHVDGPPPSSARDDHSGLST